MAKFKVGDKVIAKKGAPYVITTNGWRGVVTGIGKTGYMMKVTGHGLYLKGDVLVNQKYFDFDRSDQKIVITTDGITTTARLYSGKTVTKTATAKCSPDDTFSFEMGARIAFDRLTGLVAPVAPARENVFDWDDFKKGKFVVSVNKDNIRAFRAEAKKHGLTFGDDDEIFDPFASDFTVVLEFLELFHAKSVSPKNERLIIVDGRYLKIQLPSTLSSLEVVRW